jgi:hypothetical protein
LRALKELLARKQLRVGYWPFKLALTLILLTKLRVLSHLRTQGVKESLSRLSLMNSKKSNKNLKNNYTCSFCAKYKPVKFIKFAKDSSKE